MPHPAHNPRDSVSGLPKYIASTLPMSHLSALVHLKNIADLLSRPARHLGIGENCSETKSHSIAQATLELYRTLLGFPVNITL